MKLQVAIPVVFNLFSIFFFSPSSVGTSGSLLFSYHVIVEKLLRLDSIASGQHEKTLAGPGYQVRNDTRNLQGRDIRGGMTHETCRAGISGEE